MSTAGPTLPDFSRTTRLVARALRVDPVELPSWLRCATEADLDAITRLRQSAIGDQIQWDDARYLRWRYRLGRAGEGRGDLWVLFKGDELLAMIGLEDMTLQVAGKQVAVHRVMDLLVDPRWQESGMGLWINQAITQRFANVIAVGSNTQSAGLVSRAYQALEGRRTHVRPVRFNGYVLRRIRFKPLACVVSAMLNFGVHVASLFTLGLGRQGIHVRHESHLPPDTEALIARAQHPDRIEVVRSLAHWSWRLQSPRGHFDIWVAREPVNHEMVGLMITRRDQFTPGRWCWTVMDLVLCESQRDHALRALLWRVIGEAERHGVEYLSCTLRRHDIEPELQRAGFMPHAGELRALSWMCADPVLRARGEAGADWSFCELHTDGD